MLKQRLSREGVVWLGFFALVLAAWTMLFAMTLDAPSAGLPAGAWQALCGGPRAAGYPALLAMWALMAAAMMLPGFAPAMRTFLNLGHTGATRPTDAAALVAGYAMVWLGFSAAGAGAQTSLAAMGLLSPGGQSLSLWLTAVLLLGAGLYQFSQIKAACLAKCRMPLTFFIERWAPGNARAFRMGAELGALCLGCCWALMALAFAGGTMNLVWMGAVMLFMALEKLPDIGRPLTRPLGAALILAAGVTALLALTPS
jgi:predicted metal-binding membrane protein